jgi:hypothetical protein
MLVAQDLCDINFRHKDAMPACRSTAARRFTKPENIYEYFIMLLELLAQEPSCEKGEMNFNQIERMDPVILWRIKIHPCAQG